VSICCFMQHYFYKFNSLFTFQYWKLHILLSKWKFYCLQIFSKSANLDFHNIKRFFCLFYGYRSLGQSVYEQDNSMDLCGLLQLEHNTFKSSR
jgi:hypothetical protein